MAVVIGAAKVKNNKHVNKEESTVLVCAVHWCKDSLHCSECKQMAEMVPSSVLICKPTQYISPPTVLDCALHMQV